MKQLLAAVFVLSVSTSVNAQLDPGPDGIGVYFDSGATTVQMLVGEVHRLLNQ